MADHGWMESRGYFAFADYLRQRFGVRVHKVSLHAGFTCPNRDGRVGWGGCTYCANESFSPQAQRNGESGHPPPIRDQLRRGIEYVRARYHARKFFAYFQPFTNTYGPRERLKACYDEGIAHPDVIGLAIGTRPDCVPEETLDLVAAYAERVEEVWIEYGLQSMHDRTLELVNRGHRFDAFVDAVERTRTRPIKTCAHVILGLPGESRENMMATAQCCAALKLDGIKLHHLHVVRNTPLEEAYRRGEVRTLDAEEYVSLVCDFLERLPATTTVQRLMGDAKVDLLVAPVWKKGKPEMFAAITQELKRRGTRQGSRYAPDNANRVLSAHFRAGHQ